MSEFNSADSNIVTQRSCVNCKLFTFAPDTSSKTGLKMNRECTYPGRLEFDLDYQECKMWIDPRSVAEQKAGKRLRVKGFTAKFVNKATGEIL
jgi:hypothetical protein